jgi:hypothetical protein
MHQPVDGQNDPTTPSQSAAPNDGPPSPTRRAMLGHMAMAAAAALVEANRAAAQAVPPGAGPLAHQGRWQHLKTGPGRPAPQSVDLSDEQLQSAWKAMGEADAIKARVASNQIYSAKKAVPFLKDQLKGITGNLDEKKIARLVKDLDAAAFATRAKASEDLLEMGPAIIPQLRAVLATKPPLEVMRRLEALVTQLKATPMFLRGQRGLQILTELPMKEAKDALADINKQLPDSWLTRETKNEPRPVAPVPQPPVAARP